MTDTALPGRPATRQLGAAVLLGLVADQLWWDYGGTPLSLSIVVATATLLATWLLHVTGANGRTLVWRWGSLALLCTLLTTWRASQTLQALLTFCMLGCVGLFVLQRSGLALARLQLSHIPPGLLALLHALVTRSASLLRDAALDRHLAGVGSVAVLRGLLITLPLLVLFGGLFMAADAAFANWAASLQWFSPQLPLHLCFTAFCCWLAGGTLSLALRPTVIDDSRWQLRLGATETAMVLGGLALAFVVFAGFQLDNLFSPAADNAQRSGLSIAEFARHGFFQLLWIAALALGLLTLLAPGSSAQPWYRRFAVVLLGCVLIVLVSALQRTQYYLQSYGLSEDRLVAVTFILWLGLCLPLFALTALRKQGSGFVAPASCLGLALCVLLAIANPAAWVVHANVRLAQTGERPLDALYLQRLGADAVPALVDDFALLAPEDQCRLGRYLLDTWQDAGRSLPAELQDWRAWRLARTQAEAAVAAGLGALQQATSATTCPAPVSAASP